MAADEVSHDGIVKRIEGDKVFVSIIAKAACLSCQMNNSCSTSELSEKLIEVNRYDVNFTVGENVSVALKETSGIKALMIGYMIPFILMIVTLIIVGEFTENEIIIGLSSLGILAPYYFSLFVLQDFLKKQFSFFVHKQ